MEPQKVDLEEDVDEEPSFAVQSATEKRAGRPQIGLEMGNIGQDDQAGE